jgi:hypothetical protein
MYELAGGGNSKGGGSGCGGCEGGGVNNNNNNNNNNKTTIMSRSAWESESESAPPLAANAGNINHRAFTAPAAIGNGRARAAANGNSIDGRVGTRANAAGVNIERHELQRRSHVDSLVVNLPAQVTAVASHPSLPFVVVGMVRHVTLNDPIPRVCVVHLVHLLIS